MTGTCWRRSSPSWPTGSRGSAGTALARATGLRNVVAHVYAQADPALVFQAATNGLDDLERFSRDVARWTEGRTAH